MQETRELDYLLERLTNLHVTRPQVHLQGITESSTVHPCYQGPSLHAFVSSTICKSKLCGLNSNMKFDNACKNVELKIQS